MTRVLPAEWECHRSTILAWPTREAVWGEYRRFAEDEYATLANTIAVDEPVLVICRPEDVGRVRELCPTDAIEILEHPIDDGWIRDNGPLVVFDGAGQRAVAFGFNSWGERFAPTVGDLTVRRAIAGALDESYEDASDELTLEGGALSSNGAGTLLVAAECALTESRNPGMGAGTFEAILERRLGAERVVWVPHGLIEDLPNTDGHVDNVAVFVDAETVLVQGVPPDNHNHSRLDRNAMTLAASLCVVKCEVLPYASLPDGTRQPVPYINFVLTNESVVLPSADDRHADAYASGLFAELFPSRRVKFVPAVIMAYGGGGPHCVTMQVPAQTRRT
jgi:agmatine deiminase